MRNKQSDFVGKPSAYQTYERRRKDVANVLDWIEMEIERHHVEAQSDKTNWGYAGDIGGLRDRLMEALADFSGGAVQDVEDALAECENDSIATQ